MSSRKTHLGAARQHGHKALLELRKLTADSALHWILSHQRRISQFRRAIKGTRAQAPFAQFLAGVRHEATVLPARKSKPKPGKRRAMRSSRPAYGTYF